MKICHSICISDGQYIGEIRRPQPQSHFEVKKVWSDGLPRITVGSRPALVIFSSRHIVSSGRRLGETSASKIKTPSTKVRSATVKLGLLRRKSRERPLEYLTWQYVPRHAPSAGPTVVPEWTSEIADDLYTQHENRGYPSICVRSLFKESAFSMFLFWSLPYCCQRVSYQPSYFPSSVWSSCYTHFHSLVTISIHHAPQHSFTSSFLCGRSRILYTSRDAPHYCWF